jgi:hypothetical protein
MATHTLVTSAPLTCVAYSPAPQTLLPTDLAAVSQLIKDDLNTSHPFIRGAFDQRGLLVVPNRWAEFRLFPGDVVAVDANGWPVVVSAYSIATGGWTFT